MGSQSLNSRLLMVKSIVYSLLLHGLIFSSVVLVFPVLRESHKPGIIFLGSILQSSDLSDAQPIEYKNPAALQNLKKIENPSSLYEGGVQKPERKPENNPLQKRTLKENDFDEAEPKPKEGGMLAPGEELTIEQSIEPYKPLRLKDSD